MIKKRFTFEQSDSKEQVDADYDVVNSVATEKKQTTTKCVKYFDGVPQIKVNKPVPYVATVDPFLLECENLSRAKDEFNNCLSTRCKKNVLPKVDGINYLSSLHINNYFHIVNSLYNVFPSNTFCKPHSCCFEGFNYSQLTGFATFFGYETEMCTWKKVTQKQNNRNNYLAAFLDSTSDRAQQEATKINWKKAENFSRSVFSNFQHSINCENFGAGSKKSLNSFSIKSFNIGNLCNLF